MNKSKVVNSILLVLLVLSLISLIYGKLGASQERIEIVSNKAINYPEVTKKVKLFLENNPNPTNYEMRILEDEIDKLLLASKKIR